MKTLKAITSLAGRLRRDPKCRAFTLIDLLATLAVVAILGCLSLGAAATSRTASQTLQCLQNVNQLIRAWTMYAVDNQGLLAPNSDDGQYGNWVGGQMDATATYNDPTNFGLINNTYAPAVSIGLNHSGPSAMAGYLRDYKIAKCPADPSKYGDSGADPGGTKGGASDNWGPRVRTYAMSQAVGTQDKNKLPVTGPWLTGTYGGNRPGNPYNTYGNLGSWGNPGPANTFVMVDEDPYSINDETLAVTCSLPDQIQDWPASFHDHGAVFSFADGHVILKHWVDPRTYSIQTIRAPAIQPENPDLDWLRLHTSGNGNGNGTPLPLSTTPSP